MKKTHVVRTPCLFPGYSPEKTKGVSVYDAEAGEMAVSFIENALVFIEGDKANQPFVMEEWQRDIVRAIFGYKNPDGTRRYREIFIFVPRKNGKALALDTPIPTPLGWTTMGELTEGDAVFDETGGICHVTYATDVMYGHECYEVAFSDGTTIVADAEHLWQTESRRAEYKSSLRTTQQIAETLRSGQRTTHREHNHRIRVAGSLATLARSFLVAPYVLGCWLGDGNSDDSRITIGEQDAELVGLIQDAGCQVSGGRRDGRSKAVRYRLGSGVACRNDLPSMRADLRRLGVLKNKHIPRSYLRGSIPQRMALLQGLMDTDGSIAKDGQCELTTVLPVLRDDVLELVRSLGIKATCRTHRAKIYGRDCGERHRIQFRAYSNTPVFRLRRKFDRQPQEPIQRQRSSSLYITDVRPMSSVPVRCIRVDSESHLYLAGKGFTPTHNTPLAAAIINYVAYCDDEPGAQLYCAAGDKDQASLVFRHSAGMIRRNPELNDRARIYRTTRVIEINNGETLFKALPYTPEAMHGLNCHLVVVDELHVQPDRRMVDNLITGIGSRRQPLVIYITTAGFDKLSICYEKYDYACKVRDGMIDDPSFLPVVYETTETEDWANEDVWAKANPNLGVSVTMRYLRDACRKAKEMPVYENTFRRLHLNQWTEQDVRWLPMTRWADCNEIVEEEELVGHWCYAGLDLSSKKDITAFVMVFPIDGKLVLVPRFWMPAEMADIKEREDRVPYRQWGKEGWITLTPGNTIDYNIVMSTIMADASKYEVKGVGFDRWAFEPMRQAMIGFGFPSQLLVEYGQGYQSMSSPSKEFEAAILRKQIVHNNNPVLKWMVGNVVIDQDPAGNIKPTKAKSPQRIDGVVAAVMALGLLNTSPGRSVYEERGIDAI